MIVVVVVDVSSSNNKWFQSQYLIMSIFHILLTRPIQYDFPSQATYPKSVPIRRGKSLSNNEEVTETL